MLVEHGCEGVGFFDFLCPSPINPQFSQPVPAKKASSLTSGDDHWELLALSIVLNVYLYHAFHWYFVSYVHFKFDV